MFGPFIFKALLLITLLFILVPAALIYKEQLNKDKQNKKKHTGAIVCMLIGFCLLSAPLFLMWVGSKSTAQATQLNIASAQIFNTSLTVESMEAIVPELNTCERDELSKQLPTLKEIPTLFELNLGLIKCSLFTYNKSADSKDIKEIQSILVRAKADQESEMSARIDMLEKKIIQLAKASSSGDQITASILGAAVLDQLVPASDDGALDADYLKEISSDEIDSDEGLSVLSDEDNRIMIKPNELEPESLDGLGSNEDKETTQTDRAQSSLAFDIGPEFEDGYDAVSVDEPDEKELLKAKGAESPTDNLSDAQSVSSEDDAKLTHNFTAP